ncbi:MAG: D-alanyl-D-alanine dipeptidase (EC [uncultured Sulfurovum sp.]|uniref:D-alanyl-D-alanine dipeptidase n=1 Tax=uncultured Sulfurovum sp. TaxID=269237 RepID=A0A6S6T3L3_9BACT|nr:MAG: D-alanyl-D-alanine dipeptidase (EC [uncultured Sulfurovum sp.]
MLKNKLFFLLPLSLFIILLEAKIPKGFVYVDKQIPNILLEIKYFSEDNFVGEVISGYLAPKAILSNEAVVMLSKVQKELNAFGLGLKIFDAYRPQKAVDHFVRWGHELSNTKMKAIYYPNVQKKDLFREGYIAKKSGHSRGSTVDLSIIDLETQKALDMGSTFDFFGERSWLKYQQITAKQRANRMLLNALMLKHGFKAYAEEWWHFTLKNEPYKHHYFDFDVQ